MNRRVFLVSGAAAAGSLVLGTSFSSGDGDSASDPFSPGPFVSIDPNGAVTVTVARAEIGQGSRTALAMIVAEELDADWSKVRIEQADLDPKYGDQFVGGSAVVRTSWKPLRQAGAAARAMLVAAAASRWGVEPTDCRTDSGSVLHPKSGRVADYGGLVVLARAQAVPKNAPLKDPSAFRIIGKSCLNVDHPAIVAGKMKFGIDIKVPGMLVAVIERAPVFGGRLAHLKTDRSKAVPGVRDVVVVDADAFPEFGENNPKPANGVAIIASSTWAALEGRRALEVEWDDRGGAVESVARMRAECIAARGRPDRWVTEQGGPFDSALAGCQRRIEAVYETPLLAHAPIEPMSCVADVRQGHCEVWAPAQNPEYVRDIAEKITGLAVTAITVHVGRMGGAFGRRFYADYAAEAIFLSKAVGSPVQVVWTREDDLRHDFYRPAGHHFLRGGLDERGSIAAWEHRLFNASRGHFLRWKAPAGKELNPGEVSTDDYPVSLAPAFRFAYTPIDSKIPRGQWRAVENSSNVFVIQSFLDELAHLAGTDPLAFQLDLLATRRDRLDSTSGFDGERLSRVLRIAGERSGWGQPLQGKGRGRGIAACFADGSYIAEVAELTAGEAGRVKVDRVVCVVDCGIVVHPEGARAQVEGSITMGLSAALGEEITVTAGRVDQGNFDSYPILRIDRAPVIDVHFINGGMSPSGLGEPALPPIAPAVTNAIFAATGRRVRRLPIEGSAEA